MHSALQPLSVPRSSCFHFFFLFIYFSTGFSLLTELSPVDFLPLPSTYAPFGPNFFVASAILRKPFKIQLATKGVLLDLAGEKGNWMGFCFSCLFIVTRRCKTDMHRFKDFCIKKLLLTVIQICCFTKIST